MTSIQRKYCEIPWLVSLLHTPGIGRCLQGISESTVHLYEGDLEIDGDVRLDGIVCVLGDLVVRGTLRDRGPCVLLVLGTTRVRVLCLTQTTSVFGGGLEVQAPFLPRSHADPQVRKVLPFDPPPEVSGCDTTISLTGELIVMPEKAQEVS